MEQKIDRLIELTRNSFQTFSNIHIVLGSDDNLFCKSFAEEQRKPKSDNEDDWNLEK